MYLMTKALKPLLLLLNHYRSRHLLQKEECNPPQQSTPKFFTPQQSTIGCSTSMVGHSRLCPSIVGLRRRQSTTEGTGLPGRESCICTTCSTPVSPICTCHHINNTNFYLRKLNLVSSCSLTSLNSCQQMSPVLKLQLLNYFESKQ